MKTPPRPQTLEELKAYLQNIYQDILFWLLCAPDILQQYADTTLDSFSKASNT